MVTLPQLPEIHIGALSNGMKYVFIPDKGSGLIQAEVIGYAGSLLETDPRTYGVAHFLEHVACKGTKSFPNESVLTDEFDMIGAYRNAWTSSVYKKYYIKTDVSKGKQAIKFMAECITSPVFNERIIERERSVIQNELRDALAKEDVRMAIKCGQELYDFPRFNVHPVLGSYESINNITKENLIQFWGQFYNPSNFVFGVVGDIDHEELVTLMEQEIGFVPCGTAPAKIFPGLKKITKIISTDQNIKNSQIQIVWPISRADLLRDYYKVNALISIIGGMRRSRLFRILREDSASVYAVRMSLSGFRDPVPRCSIVTSTNIESVDSVVSKSIECVNSFLRDGPTDREIEQAVSQYIFGTKVAIAKKSSLLGSVLSSVLFNPTFDSPEDELNKLINFDISESMDALRSLFEKEPIFMITNPS